MAVAFSDDGQRLLEQKIVLSAELTGGEEHDDFDAAGTAAWISKLKLQRVALQFPDELLVYSTRIVTALQSLLKLTSPTTTVFVLGDTSYGSCCVDEVAAQHGCADGLVHYGRSCLSSTARIPVRYVFGRKAIDVAHLMQCFEQLYPDGEAHVVVLYDTVYAHAMDDLKARLSAIYQNVIVSSLLIPEGKRAECSDSTSSCPTTDSCCGTSMSSCHPVSNAIHADRPYLGRVFELEKDKDYQAFYVGGEGSTLNSLMLTYNQLPFSSYCPQLRRSRKETMNVNQALRRRYLMMEKARDAEVIGIVAGTLGVSNYLEVIAKLKELMRACGKKAYTFVMGKINVPKLSNFQEIQAFVLVACPENALIESRNFMVPIVTPFEMEMACSRREWNNEYTTDFQQLLAATDADQTGGADTDLHVFADQDIPRQSLLTTRLYNTKPITPSNLLEPSSNNKLSVRSLQDQLALAQSPAASHLATRMFRGLEQKLGETPVVKAVPGRSGIARGYTHETQEEKVDDS